MLAYMQPLCLGYTQCVAVYLSALISCLPIAHVEIANHLDSAKCRMQLADT